MMGLAIFRTADNQNSTDYKPVTLDDLKKRYAEASKRTDVDGMLGASRLREYITELELKGEIELLQDQIDKLKKELEDARKAD